MKEEEKNEEKALIEFCVGRELNCDVAVKGEHKLGFAGAATAN